MDKEAEYALIREYQEARDEERRILSQISEVRQRMIRSGKLQGQGTLHAMVTGRFSDWRLEEAAEMDVKLFSFREWLDFVQIAESLPKGTSPSWEEARKRTAATLEKVIMQFYGVIAKVRRRLGVVKRPLADDMDAEGVVGIVRALERFDLSTGSIFSSYCSYWVMAMMLRAIDTNQMIRLPESAKILRRRIFSYLEENKKSLDTMSPWDMASLFDVPEELLQSCLISFKSLDAPIDVRDEHTSTLGELISLNEEKDGELMVYDQKVLNDRLRKIVAEMEPDVREAALLRFPFSDPTPKTFHKRSLSEAVGFLKNYRASQLKLLLEEEEQISSRRIRERPADSPRACETRK